MDEHGQVQRTITPSDLATYRNAADWLARPPFVVGAAQAWTRRVFDRFGPLPPGVVAEDLLMVFRAIVSGGALTLPEPLVRYRRGGVSGRRRAMSAQDVVAGLLKNNRSSLVELPQLLADARVAGQYQCVEGALSERLVRERFIRDMFAAKQFSVWLSLAVRADKLPLSLRLRVFAYAGLPGLLSPWFAVKRLLARKR